MSDTLLTILVVDDDADARAIMAAALRKAGYAPRLADSGASALREFRSSPTDMVMLDVEMPDMDGYAVCTALRREAGALLPIVMVTGMDDLHSIERAYQSGATDFIAKPVHWGLVGHRVRYLFRGYQAALALRNAEARHAGVLSAIPDLLFEVDKNGRCLDCRIPSSHELATYARSFMDRSINEILDPDAARICQEAVNEALREGHAEGAQFSYQMDGKTMWFELSISRKPADRGDQPSVIMLARDITERRRINDRVKRLAFFDELTGLPNRQSFIERIEGEIRHSGPSTKRFAILFMDLDGFKNVNDSLGHTYGDQLLRWTAERLTDCLRPGDLVARHGREVDGTAPNASSEIQIARLGGDEFTALVVDIHSAEDVLAVAKRVGHALRRPFALEGREITLTSSIGIAVYPDDGHDAATLLKHADTAMYHAKRSGRDNAKLYNTALTEEITARLELESSLRQALQNNEFHLVYQPQINLATGLATSIEALIRWQHPSRGLIPPLVFIPVAEECGLIDQIGEWVLRTATIAAKGWTDAGADITITVNLSPLQFARPGLAQRVLSILSETGLAPDRLELEVTESALMENSARTRETLTILRDHGIQIALDDFGTGYSSLAYLTQMPISRIKVDRAFVDGLLSGTENEAIVQAVLAMANSLGMHVTAEGVETLDQANRLRAMACHTQQGFYFSRPVSAEAIPALLARPWHLPAPERARNRTGS